MASAEQILDLQNQVVALKVMVATRDTELKEAQTDVKSAQDEVKRLVSENRELSSVNKQTSGSLNANNESSTKERTVYLTQTRRIDRFRGKPEKSTDITVDEWVDDIQSILATRRYSLRDQAAFIIENLAGEARREIIGRGSDIREDPDKIISVLLKVFGDGDDLPQLQRRFFGYKQSDKEDIVTCSLHLVDLFDKMVKLDSSLKVNRDVQLRNRLAEAVRDESVRMELRRLNRDHPEYTFFEARDYIVSLMGHSDKTVKPKSDTSIHEISVDNEMKIIMKQLSDQLASQQKQIDSLCKLVRAEPKNKRQIQSGKSNIECWNCNTVGHIRRNCPKLKRHSTSASHNKDSKDLN